MIYTFAILLMGIGMYGLISQKNLFKQLISLTIVDTAVNIFIIAVGYVEEGKAPIYFKGAVDSSVRFVDPLPQALVLTAIVIGLGILALGAVLLIKINEKHGNLDVEKMRGVEE